MSGIPSDLNKRIREALLNCGPFDEPQRLRALFSLNTQLSPWQHSIPTTSASMTGQVDTLIAFLYNKPYDKPNPLITFLRTLSEHTDKGIGCQQTLLSLANELAGTLGEESAGQPITPPSSLSKPRSVTQDDLKLLHQALKDTYSLQDLRQLTFFVLDVDIDDITRGGTRDTIILDLVQWTARRGRTVELICGAIKDRPHTDNRSLRELADRYCQ